MTEKIITKKNLITVLLVSALATVVAQISTWAIHAPSLKNTVLVFAMSVFYTAAMQFLAKFVFKGAKTAYTVLSVISAMGVLTHSCLASILFVNCVAALILQRDCRRNKLRFSKNMAPAIVFSAFAMIAGCIIIFVTPVLHISYDEATHYRRTLFLSEGIYAAEDSNDRYMNKIIMKMTPLDDPDPVGTDTVIIADSSALLPTRIGYLGYAAGMWVARFFRLPFILIYRFGKIGNLLLYSLLIASAISRLKSGRYLLFAIGALPLPVFLASCYSYDSWTFAFIALSFAIFFSAMEKEEKISEADTVSMVSYMVLGVLPKMGYSVLIVLLLLMPAFVFPTKQGYKQYKRFCLFTLVLVLAYFLVEYFAFGALGDERGGAQVDAMGQLQYITSNPGAYLTTLSAFLKQYFASYSFVTSFAYLGNGKYWLAAWLLVILVALLNSKTSLYIPLKTRILGILLIFIFVCLTCTALYIDFTPVGLSTINGCQPRYMLPLLLPAFMLLLNGWHRFKIPDKLVAGCTYAVCAFVLGTTLYSNMILKF